MSLEIPISNEKGTLSVKTTGLRIGTETPVYIQGDFLNLDEKNYLPDGSFVFEIDISSFCKVIKYYFANGPLNEFDVRRQLLSELKICFEKGYPTHENSIVASPKYNKGWLQVQSLNGNKVGLKIEADTVIIRLGNTDSTLRRVNVNEYSFDLELESSDFAKMVWKIIYQSKMSELHPDVDKLVDVLLKSEIKALNNDGQFFGYFVRL